MTEGGMSAEWDANELAIFPSQKVTCTEIGGKWETQ